MDKKILLVDLSQEIEVPQIIAITSKSVEVKY